MPGGTHQGAGVETIIFVSLGVFALWIIGLVCHQYFFSESFTYTDDKTSEGDSNIES